MDDMGYGSDSLVESADKHGLGELIGFAYFGALVVAAVAGIVVAVLAITGII